MDVISAIKNRASVRAFLDKAVSRHIISAILDAARWAPSGVNTQPWQVVVLQGDKKNAVSQAMLQQHQVHKSPRADYQYYPSQWFEPYKSRRFACGMALYGALGIERDDVAKRREVWELNYHFFHAPVGLLFFIDAALEKGSWLDYGMFLQNVMLAARGHGLETCPQAALAEHPQIIRELLGIDDDKSLICGMAIGYPDPNQAINQYRTQRAEVDEFTSW